MKQYWNKFISLFKIMMNVRQAIILVHYGKIQEAKNIMMK